MRFLKHPGEKDYLYDSLKRCQVRPVIGHLARMKHMLTLRRLAIASVFLVCMSALAGCVYHEREVKETAPNSVVVTPAPPGGAVVVNP